MKTKSWVGALATLGLVQGVGGGCGQEPSATPSGALASSRALSASAELLPSLSPPGTRTVTAVASERGPLLRWRDPAGEHWRRLAPDGSWLDADEVAFPADILALADDGVGFVAAISPGYGQFHWKLSVMRLSETGAPLADPTTVVSLPMITPAWMADAGIAHQGTATFVLWSEALEGSMTHPQLTKLHGLRLVEGVAETVSLPMPPASTGMQDQRGSVASSAGGFSLVYSASNWERFLPPGVPPPPPYANRWEPTVWTGAIVPASSGSDNAMIASLPPTPVQPDPWPYLSTKRYNDQPHALASDGASYLLAWLDGEVVWGQRRGADLAPLGEPFVIAMAPRATGGLAATFNAGNYVIAWSDGRATATGVDLYAARVTPDGGVVDSEPLAVTAGPGDESITALVPNGSCCVLVTYNSTGDGNARVVDLAAPIVRKTSLAYLGATTGVFGRPATFSARLGTDAGAVAGQTVTFMFGTQGCTAVTDPEGRAECTIAPNAPAGPYPVEVRFAGAAELAPSQAAGSFYVTRDWTTIVYRGPRLLRGNDGVVLGARLFLRDDKTSPLAGQTVTFTLQVRWATRSCTAVTDSAGSASCPIGLPRLAGRGTVTARFAGDGGHDGTEATVPVVSIWNPPRRGKD